MSSAGDGIVPNTEGALDGKHVAIRCKSKRIQCSRSSEDKELMSPFHTVQLVVVIVLFVFLGVASITFHTFRRAGPSLVFIMVCHWNLSKTRYMEVRCNSYLLGFHSLFILSCVTGFCCFSLHLVPTWCLGAYTNYYI